LKARNFLVFQGDVEGMARKTPKQVCAVYSWRLWRVMVDISYCCLLYFI
jgi:hypothetical protein